MKRSPANRGRALESVVIASQGAVVVLDQHGQEARRLPGGRMVAKRGPVDFTGTVKGTGRSIRFDAKRCDLATRFPIGNRDHFPEHQRQHLIRHGKAGAVAGLLVEATALGEFRWMDWWWVEYAGVKGLPSVPWTSACWIKLGPTSHAIRMDLVPGIVVERPDNPYGDVFIPDRTQTIHLPPAAGEGGR